MRWSVLPWKARLSCTGLWAPVVLSWIPPVRSGSNAGRLSSKTDPSTPCGKWFSGLIRAMACSPKGSVNKLKVGASSPWGNSSIRKLVTGMGANVTVLALALKRRVGPPSLGKPRKPCGGSAGRTLMFGEVDHRFPGHLGNGEGLDELTRRLEVHAVDLIGYERRVCLLVGCDDVVRLQHPQEQLPVHRAVGHSHQVGVGRDVEERVAVPAEHAEVLVPGLLVEVGVVPVLGVSLDHGLGRQLGRCHQIRGGLDPADRGGTELPAEEAEPAGRADLQREELIGDLCVEALGFNRSPASRRRRGEGRQCARAGRGRPPRARSPAVAFAERARGLRRRGREGWAARSTVRGADRASRSSAAARSPAVRPGSRRAAG